MSLYQEVRPADLSGIIGNVGTISALKKMLEKPQKPHAMLFWGPYGCGKTTVARIVASALGCSDQGIMEYNTANLNGIGTVRQIIAEAHQTVIGGGSKCYILDESHELTKPAQEAFLKVLEDYPPNTYFIFCTTNPGALLDTLLSRCTKYEFCKQSEGNLLDLLHSVCRKKSEYSEVPDEYLQAIAVTSDGSPRNALVSLEQVANMSDLDEVIQLLVRGTEKDAQVIELCKLMYASPKVRRQKFPTIIRIFDSLQEDPEKIRKAILTFLYKKLLSAQDESEAIDLSYLIHIFSTSVFYGNKAQLGALVARACFGKNHFLGEV